MFCALSLGFSLIIACQIVIELSSFELFANYMTSLIIIMSVMLSPIINCKQQTTKVYLLVCYLVMTGVACLHVGNIKKIK